MVLTVVQVAEVAIGLEQPLQALAEQDQVQEPMVVIQMLLEQMEAVVVAAAEQVLMLHQDQAAMEGQDLVLQVHLEPL
jgi:hypothetical protein